jgi:DNA-binding MarR family transcriptional regulator
MALVDRKAGELRLLVEDILTQFRCVDAATVNGPHAELSVQELRVVEHLGDAGPRMMRELAQFLLLAVNSVTSLVDNLEAKCLVRRNRSEQDRRVIRVELTEAGKVAYDAAVREKVALLRRMLKVLTEDEQEIFLVLFRKIARAGKNQVSKVAAPA